MFLSKNRCPISLYIARRFHESNEADRSCLVGWAAPVQRIIKLHRVGVGLLHMVDRADAGILCRPNNSKTSVTGRSKYWSIRYFFPSKSSEVCPKPSCVRFCGVAIEDELDEHLVDQVLVVQQTAFQLQQATGSGLAPARWRRRPVPSHPRSAD